MIDLLHEYEALTGAPPKKESSKSYCGPCPKCGGSDRFVILPAESRWFCRGCEPRGGDLEGFLMMFRNLNFAGACELTGRDAPGRGRVRAIRPNGPSWPLWSPRQAEAPPEAWQEKAESLVEWAADRLWSERGAMILEYLRGRGLTDETIRAAELGYLPQDLYRNREAWGLPAELNDKGKPKRLWLPGGIVIPCRDHQGGRVIRLRFRRIVDDDRGRYIACSGSDCITPMTLGTSGPAAMVVESELDAILIHQAAGDLITVLALGSASIRPDMLTAGQLKRAEIILVALDRDEAGTKNAQWWFHNFRRAVQWTIPAGKGKDPGEFHQGGGDLRLWVRAGLWVDDKGRALDKQGRVMAGG